MKMVFWGVYVIGFGLCSTVGIGPVLARSGGSWAAPAMIAGSVVGVALLVLGAMSAFGVRLPLLATDTAMVAALATLIAVKVAIASVPLVSLR